MGGVGSLRFAGVFKQTPAFLWPGFGRISVPFKPGCYVSRFAGNTASWAFSCVLRLCCFANQGKGGPIHWVGIVLAGG